MSQRPPGKVLWSTWCEMFARSEQTPKAARECYKRLFKPAKGMSDRKIDSVIRKKLDEAWVQEEIEAAEVRALQNRRAAAQAFDSDTFDAAHELLKLRNLTILAWQGRFQHVVETGDKLNTADAKTTRDTWEATHVLGRQPEEIPDAMSAEDRKDVLEQIRLAMEQAKKVVGQPQEKPEPPPEPKGHGPIIVDRDGGTA